MRDLRYYKKSRSRENFKVFSKPSFRETELFLDQAFSRPGLFATWLSWDQASRDLDSRDQVFMRPGFLETKPPRDQTFSRLGILKRLALLEVRPFRNQPFSRQAYLKPGLLETKIYRDQVLFRFKKRDLNKALLLMNF